MNFLGSIIGARDPDGQPADALPAHAAAALLPQPGHQHRHGQGRLVAGDQVCRGGGRPDADRDGRPAAGVLGPAAHIRLPCGGQAEYRHGAVELGQVRAGDLLLLHRHDPQQLLHA